MNVAAYGLYRGDYAARGLSGAPGFGDGPFSSVFGSTMRGFMAKGGIQEALASLRERFPAAQVAEGEVEPGIEGGKKQYGDKATSDRVTVSSALLAGMVGSANLAGMVQDAIAGFLERGDGGNLMNIQGATVQRTVTITYTQIRYGEFHRDPENGEILGANEFKTNFHDRLAELIKKFFGVPEEEAASDAEADESEAEETNAPDASKPAAPASSPSSAASVSMWSLEVYFSFTYINSTLDAGTGGAGSAQGSWQGASASWQSSSFAAGLRGVLGGFLPSAFRGAAGPGEGSGGSLFDFLEETLAGMGLSAGGYQESQEGLFFRLREGRNLIAELMELYGGRINPKPAVETAPAEETATQPESEEVPVEPAAIA